MTDSTEAEEASPQDGLARLRAAIDGVNMELLRLLNRRARLAQEVGEAKRSLEARRLREGEPDRAAPFFVPSRESQIYERLEAANDGPLSDEAISAIFREIISQCRALEEPIRVAYWGPQGSHSHLAALRQFGTAAEFIPVASIAAVFDHVEKRLAQYGVVPAGNSIEGVMSRTLDLLATQDPRICVETYLPISYDLLSQCAALTDIRRVYASAQPLALCSGWLAQHLPACEIVEVPAISKAITAATEDPEGAALATPLEAEHPGVYLLQSHVEDDPRARGRFFTIGFNEPSPSGRDKTSLIVTLHHEPGAMVNALNVFSRHGVNLLFVQSRHSLKQSNVYRLFVDLQGFVADEAIASALGEMTREGILFEVLGSYPDALPPMDEPTD